MLKTGQFLPESAQFISNNISMVKVNDVVLLGNLREKNKKILHRRCNFQRYRIDKLRSSVNRNGGEND